MPGALIVGIVIILLSVSGPLQRIQSCSHIEGPAPFPDVADVADNHILVDGESGSHTHHHELASARHTVNVDGLLRHNDPEGMEYWNYDEQDDGGYVGVPLHYLIVAERLASLLDSFSIMAFTMRSEIFIPQKIELWGFPAICRLGGESLPFLGVSY